jgi:hypothetical protein
MSAMAEDSRVLDKDGAHDICENNENGKGQLPMPRNKLEAMSAHVAVELFPACYN